jgi:serine/threonine-protein kinase
VSAENLFVTYDGATQVVDFGVAHARQRVHNSEAGQVKGTFPYMAPEQMTSAVVDRRVDIWALGAVLWELLTLRKLFLRETDVNTMYAVLSGEIQPPSAYRSEVSSDLDEIVLKALQRSPDERWQSAREMGRALRRYLAKQDELIGPAEIADWMRQLFPSGELRKRELMEIARSREAVESETAAPIAAERDERVSRFPVLMVDRMPPAPPLPASLLVMLIGVLTVLAVVTVDWLRQ